MLGFKKCPGFVMVWIQMKTRKRLRSLRNEMQSVEKSCNAGNLSITKSLI